MRCTTWGTSTVPPVCVKCNLHCITHHTSFSGKCCSLCTCCGAGGTWVQMKFCHSMRHPHGHEILSFHESPPLGAHECRWNFVIPWVQMKFCHSTNLPYCVRGSHITFLRLNNQCHDRRRQIPLQSPRSPCIAPTSLLWDAGHMLQASRLHGASVS